MSGFLKTVLMILVLISYFLFILFLSILQNPESCWDELIILISASLGLWITVSTIKKIQPNP
jgi:hypothetical protein